MNLNPFSWSYRTQCLVGGIGSFALIGFAVFTQLFGGLEPCPLCIFQRVAYAGVGVVLLVAGLHAPRGMGMRTLYGVLALLAAIAGIAIAGRHVWLQHLPPDQVPMCGPGLEYMLEALPIGGVIRKVLTGSGECAKVDWTLLGLSMPEWSLLCFVLLAVWVLVVTFRRR